MSLIYGIIVVFGFGSYFTYKMIKDIYIPNIRKSYWAHWDKINQKYIKMANCYLACHDMHLRPRDLDPPAKDISDPRYKKAQADLCREYCGKIRRGEIPDEELRRCCEVTGRLDFDSWKAED